MLETNLPQFCEIKSNRLKWTITLSFFQGNGRVYSRTFQSVELLSMQWSLCEISRKFYEATSRRGFFKIISIRHFSRTFFKMSRKPRSLGQLEASTISWLIVSKSMRNACTEIWIEICAPHTSTSSSTGNSNYGEYYQRVVELFKNCVSNCIVRIIENIYIRNKNIRLNTFFFPMCVELMKKRRVLLNY